MNESDYQEVLQQEALLVQLKAEAMARLLARVLGHLPSTNWATHQSRNLESMLSFVDVLLANPTASRQ